MGSGRKTGVGVPTGLPPLDMVLPRRFNGLRAPEVIENALDELLSLATERLLSAIVGEPGPMGTSAGRNSLTRHGGNLPACSSGCKRRAGETCLPAVGASTPAARLQACQHDGVTCPRRPAPPRALVGRGPLDWRESSLPTSAVAKVLSSGRGVIRRGRLPLHALRACAPASGNQALWPPVLRLTNVRREKWRR